MKVVVRRVNTNVNLMEFYHDNPPSAGDTLLIGDEPWLVTKRIIDLCASPITMFAIVTPQPIARAPIDLRPKGGADAGDQ